MVKVESRSDEIVRRLFMSLFGEQGRETPGIEDKKKKKKYNKVLNR